jgi:hypothetical protein
VSLGWCLRIHPMASPIVMTRNPSSDTLWIT